MTTATIPVDFVDLFEDSSSLPFTPLWKELFQPPKSTPATRYHFPTEREKEDAWAGVTTEPVGAREEKSPFEELYALLPAEKRVERTIQCVKNLRSLPYAERIAERLRWLQQASLDEEDEAGIVPESLSSFLEFMESVQGLQYPDIVLSPEGNLVARWRADQNRNLCIEFLSQDARFVVFAPDPNRTLRVSGVVPLAKLWETLKPYSIELWVVNDNRG